VPGASFSTADYAGIVYYNGDPSGPSQRHLTGTLPAEGYSEHWYLVRFQTGSIPGETLYGPAFVIYDSAQQTSFDYVVDAYNQYGQPLNLCIGDPALQGLPARGVTEWFGNPNNFKYDPSIYSDRCALPMTDVYLRVRPISLNYQCAGYDLVVFNG
jgi:hypothetical protein